MEKMSFSGRGTLNAGTYGEISFSGSGKINGDIVCEELDACGAVSSSGSVDCSGPVSCSGSFHCQGSLKARVFDGSGSTRIDGDAEINENCDCSGSFHVGGNFTGGKLDCSGSVQVGGNINRGSVDSSGSLKVGHDLKGTSVDTSGRIEIGGDCEVESFESSGMVNIKGLLNADRIEIRLGGRDSNIREVGGDHITVRRSEASTFLGLFRSSPGSGMLVVDSIEGDDITLENTRAKIVRGSKINIGSGCEIDLVEYSDTCVVDANSKVGERNKL
jgi:cytoskeletal protein CcmA (bactofilin family)